MSEYNIYCDESCHLEYDRSPVFVLGGIYCKKEYAKRLSKGIVDIKVSYGHDPMAEIKWTKVSPGNVEMYLDFVDYFFDHADEFRFRGYVARGKDELNHAAYNQTYDLWYYKMYYRMLEYVFDTHPADKFNLLIDIKDTHGSDKVQKLRSYLNSHYHCERVPVAQEVDSKQLAILQVNDLFLGALSYKFRGLKTSSAKLELIKRIEDKSNQNLLMATPYRIKNFNFYVWTPETWR